MIFKDFYEIEILANKAALELGASQFSFSLSDSIHRTFPKATLWLNDFSGVFQEYLLTVEGTIFEFYYGVKENADSAIDSKFVVLQDAVEEPTTQGILNGEIKTEMLHEYYDTQELVSAAHNNRISFIVRELADQYQFRDLDINDTGNQDTWYQMLCTNEQFMRHGLMPNAYSGNSFDTPFFMFVTLDNVFHWRHFKSLIDQAPVDTLVNLPPTEGSSSTRNAIRSIRRVHKHSKIRRRFIHQLDYTNGELLEEEDSILDYPSDTSKVQLIENEELIQSFLFQGYTESDSSRDENDIGYKIHTMRESLFTDRFLVEVPFYPELRAGKMVNLEIRLYENNSGEESSLLYRNKFLIEESVHNWNGQNQNGSTTLVVSRKNVNVPSSYLVGNQLMGG